MARNLPRPVPPDFEAVFVEIGRFDCEERYHARRDTITNWMVQLGKQRLIDARKAYVANQRARGLWPTRSTSLVEKRVSPREMGEILAEAYPAEPDIDPTLTRLAAQHLRIIRNGGFKISPTMSGGWIVGLRRMTATELLEIAVSRGFDPEILSGPAFTSEPEGGSNAQSAA